MAVTKGNCSHNLKQVFPNPVVVQSTWRGLEVIEYRVIHKLKHQIPPLLPLTHIQQVHQVLMPELLSQNRECLVRANYKGKFFWKKSLQVIFLTAGQLGQYLDSYKKYNLNKKRKKKQLCFPVILSLRSQQTKNPPPVCYTFITHQQKRPCYRAQLFISCSLAGKHHPRLPGGSTRTQGCDPGRFRRTAEHREL